MMSGQRVAGAQGVTIKTTVLVLLLAAGIAA